MQKETQKDRSTGVAWLITLRLRERQTLPWVLGILIYYGVKLKGGNEWFGPDFNELTPLSHTVTPILLYLLLCNTVLKRKMFLGIKILKGGICLLVPPSQKNNLRLCRGE